MQGKQKLKTHGVLYIRLTGVAYWVHINTQVLDSTDELYSLNIILKSFRKKTRNV